MGSNSFATSTVRDSRLRNMRPLAYCCYRAWGMLEELVAAYQVPLGQVLQPRIPGGAGKKDNERSRERQRMDRPPRDVSEYGERVEAPTASKESSPYELVFIKDTSATTCYGCKGKVREKRSSLPPPPPYDLFVRYCESARRNQDPNSSNPEMVYFHPLKSCVNLTVQDAKDGRLLV